MELNTLEENFGNDLFRYNDVEWQYLRWIV